MKRVLLVGALLGVTSITSRAQPAAAPAPSPLSNVIYGVVDLGLTYVSNIGGQHVFRGDSIGVQGSRLGFRGSKGITPELDAIYLLEAGYNPENGTLGQGGRLFGRQVFGGLRHTRYGSLQFGRQYDSLVDYVQPVTSNGTVGGVFFSHPYDNDNTDNTLRFNNVLKYLSPRYGAVGFSLSHGFSNKPGATNNNSMTSFGAGYKANDLTAGIGYLQVNNGGLNAAAANATGTAASDQIFASSRRQKVAGSGASYVIAKTVKLGAVYTRADYQGVNEATTSGVSYKFDNVEANLSYYLTPQLTLSAAYAHTKGHVSGKGPRFTSPTWDQLSVIADYQMEKGLYVYAEGICMNASGSPFIVAADGGPAAQIQIVGASTTHRQALARVGFRFNF